jgi:hypothetical protein
MIILILSGSGGGRSRVEIEEGRGKTKLLFESLKRYIEDNTTITMLPLFTILLFVASSLLLQVNAGSSDQTYYLDVQPVNTTSFLETLRLLPLSSYTLANNEDRVRIGVLGHDLARIIPDAVSILTDRMLPVTKNGERSSKIIQVNEPTVFMMNVGATQELAKLVDRLELDAMEQMQQISSISNELALLSFATGENSTLRMKEAASKAAIRKSEVELDVLRAIQEQERMEKTKIAEKEQLKRSEEMTLARIKREDEAARLHAERGLLSKFEASQRVEKAKIEAAEAVAALENEKRILFQRASEEMKVKSAKVRIKKCAV